MATNKTPMCLHPWHNIDISLNGNIMPCCKWPSNFPGEKFNIYDSDGIDQYRNSQLLQDLKTKLSNHEWHEGCVRCKTDESRGIVSKRQHDTPIYQQQLKNINAENTKFVTMATELGISCNLACAICGPGKSSTWQQVAKAQKINFVKPANRVQDRVATIKQFDSLLHFELHGGDPLITNISEHVEVLDYFINSARSNEISLKYYTNGTVYPNKKISDRWKHFKSVELSLSLDGTGPVFEYQRWPGNWSETEKTVNKLQALQKKNLKIKITVQVSFSVYNVYFLEELYQWCQAQGIKDVWFTEVIYPEQLQPTVWPRSVREQLYAKLSKSDCSQLKNIADHILNTDHSHLFEKFVRHTIDLDQQRNIDSRKFLEFSEYHHEYQHQQDINWRRFYNDIKDESWPECNSENDIDQLPARIRLEIETVHKKHC